MARCGLISTLFDLLTFVLPIEVFDAGPALLPAPMVAALLAIVLAFWRRGRH